MIDQDNAITVTDLKQYAYCPRIIFYERCLPHVRPRTYKMDAGKEIHDEEAERSARRIIQRYDITEGERRFNVQLFSESLGLRGILDELVTTPEGIAIPVDYKLANSISSNHKIQLTAYALLIEHCEHLQVEKGFIYLITTRKLIPVPITNKLRETTLKMIEDVQSIIRTEYMPSATLKQNQCTACEFRRFCNDV